MMQRLLFPVVWCIFLFPVSGFCLDYYVNGATGSDSATCGQLPTAPCKTIRKALDNISDGEVTIKIANGVYAEDHMTIEVSSSPANNIVLEGGWNYDFTNHDCSFGYTSIKLSSNISFGDFLLSLTSHGDQSEGSLTIRCMTLRNPDLNSNANAVYVHTYNHGTAKLELNHVKVTEFRGDNTIFLQNNFGGKITFILEDSIYSINRAKKDILGSASGDDVQLHILLKNNKIIGNGFIYQPHSFLDIRGHDQASIEEDLINNIIAENLSNGSVPEIVLESMSGASIIFSSTNNTIFNNQNKNNHQSMIEALMTSGSGNITIYMINSIIKHNKASHSISLVNCNTGEVLYSENSCMIHSLSWVPRPDVTVSISNYISGDAKLNSTYHLTSGSPAKNAGICGYLTGGGPYQYHRIAPYDDIDGDKRPGWGKLMGCDVGADEYRFPWILFNPATRGTRRP